MRWGNVRKWHGCGQGWGRKYRKRGGGGGGVMERGEVSAFVWG